ncbi:MAG: 1-acyl-sn-glycerol-3-phosphate acyltransferase [Parcubacteria group bacterium]|nr:1-acyl-sn-glycerol-3-phosphate acyltransferase [Parcubacteria group bacterium]
MPRTLYPILRPLFRFTYFAFLRKAEGLGNIPAQGPFIFASNHVSIPDQWLLGTLSYLQNRVPVWFVARDDYWWGPWWTKPLRNWFATLLIDWRAPAKVLKQAAAALARNEAVALYPEGTRNADPRSLALGKTGVARLALATGAPVIPVGYQGPHITSAADAIREFLFKRNTAAIAFGKPINLAGYRSTPVTRELLYEVTDRIMVEIGKLCAKRPRLHECTA